MLPGLLVTVPPLPVTVTLNVRRTPKEAVTLCAEFTFKEQLAVPLHAPLQPEKKDVAPGVAVSVTAVPLANWAEHVPVVQLMPAGEEVTVPEPAPAMVTVSG
jgi:hypothetical protein